MGKFSLISGLWRNEFHSVHILVEASNEGSFPCEQFGIAFFVAIEDDSYSYKQ